MKTEIIKKLTSLWYDYVCRDHHKDRDCHFYIQTDFCYDGDLKYSIQHYGYVSEEFDVHCSSYEDCQIKLIEKMMSQIYSAIKKEKERQAHPEDWDEDDIMPQKQLDKLIQRYEDIKNEYTHRP